MPLSPERRVAVTPVEAADYDSWLPLWRSYQSFYRTDIPLETTNVTWRRMLDGAEPVWGALARIDGRAVGMVNWIFHRSCWTAGDYCYLQDLFVDAAVRGGGVGRALIEHVYAAADRAKSPRVYWLTHETNADAMKLYDRIAERSGFVQYRRRATTLAR
jgi:GNAT superfamily N-acetyltransferase